MTGLEVVGAIVLVMIATIVILCSIGKLKIDLTIEWFRGGS